MPPYAYFKNKFVPLADAQIGVMTHSFHYATAAFEGIRGKWDGDSDELYIFRLKEHYERLLYGCRVLKIDLPHTADDLCRITVELMKKCGFKEDAYIRPMAYKSSEALGVRLHNLEADFLMFAFPWGPYLNTDGVRCCVSSWPRPAGTPQAKINGLYVNNALAKTEAVEGGFDEAVMLTSEGHVSEGSGENIFLVADGKLVTPGRADLMLVGITRNTVIELARKELGIETTERRICRSELYSAPECFFTGTAANITAVTEIDRRPIGSGKAGTVTKKLQKLYNDVMLGRNPKYKGWCTPIYKA